ncbi:hypothetical protein D9757_004795 [Collybiopsis confluens]|uniref:Peptidase M50B-like-domain-containing protein n=1 Tax=Collybiopsis confluens TaxID=2823264 RepID=A0A8H5MC79_9AGAR|nr:hypothetical protein D9757_004795 [Collybiopsis confluens]
MASPTRPPLAPPSATSTPSPSSSLTPSTDQIVVLYVLISMAVITFGFWNVPGIRHLINPLKLFTIGAHELFHIVAGILSGGRILRITIDPHIGGATIVEGGKPLLILSSGYIGSSLLGGLFVLAGWDTLIAKVMSFVLGVGLLLPLRLVRDKLTIILTIIYEGLLIGFWFIDHAQALRWYCLFVGVMKWVITFFCFPNLTYVPPLVSSALFVLWDVADDRFFHKTNDSDCTQFAILFPRIGAHLWALFWIIFQLGVLAAFVVLGLLAFKVPNADSISSSNDAT